MNPQPTTTYWHGGRSWSQAEWDTKLAAEAVVRMEALLVRIVALLENPPTTDDPAP